MKTLLLVTTLIIFLGCKVAPDQSAYEQYAVAKNWYNQGNMKKAEALLEEINGNYKNFEIARYLLAKIYFFTQQDEKAEQILLALIKKNPAFRDAQVLMVQLYIKTHKTDMALAKVHEMLKYDPFDPRLLYLAGKISELSNKTDDSILYYNRSILFADELAKTHFELAKIYNQFSLDEKTIDHLNKTLYLSTEENPAHQAAKTILKQLDGNK